MLKVLVFVVSVFSKMPGNAKRILVFIISVFSKTPFFFLASAILPAAALNRLFPILLMLAAKEIRTNSQQSLLTTDFSSP